MPQLWGRLHPGEWGSCPFLLQQQVSGAGLDDAAFAADLERVNAADKPPKNPWVS